MCREKHHDSTIPETNHLSPASQALLNFAIVTPGSEASPGAINLSACSAGSLNNYFNTSFGCGPGRAVQPEVVQKVALDST